jgi:hypothetical protein
VLQGVISEDLTAQLLLQIGSALGSEGKAGLGWAGGDGAAMLARAAGAGIASAGTAVLASDAPSAAAAAWLAERYELPVFLFIEQAKETAYVSCFDRRGLPLDRGRQRSLEGAVLRGESVRVPGSRLLFGIYRLRSDPVVARESAAETRHGVGHRRRRLRAHPGAGFGAAGLQGAP